MKAKDKIIKALFDLLSIKKFNDITISEICLVAKVHRTTFYAYYDNIFELLEEGKEITLNNFYKDSNFPKNKEFLSNEVLIPYLRFIQKNVNLYLAFFSNGDILNSKDIYKNLFENAILPEAYKKGATDIKNIEYVVRFYMGGINEIIKIWIKNNFQESEEYIASIISNIRNGNNNLEVKNEK